MNVATQPTRRLFDTDKETQLRYVPAAQTDLRKQWQEFFAAHAKCETQASYQRAQIAEHNSMEVLQP